MALEYLFDTDLQYQQRISVPADEGDGVLVGGAVPRPAGVARSIRWALFERPGVVCDPADSESPKRLELRALTCGRSQAVTLTGSPAPAAPVHADASPASAIGRRPQANAVSYQAVIGARVVPKRDEWTIHSFPT